MSIFESPQRRGQRPDRAPINVWRTPSGSAPSPALRGDSIDAVWGPGPGHGFGRIPVRELTRVVQRRSGRVEGHPTGGGVQASPLGLQRTIGNAAVARLPASDGPDALARPSRSPSVNGSSLDFQTMGEPPAVAEEESTLDQQTSLDQQLGAPPGGAGPLAAPPPAPLGAGPMAPPQPTALFITTIRSPSTPAAMAPDRIPPRVDFPVTLSVSGWHPPMAAVQIAVKGSSADNGAATVDNAASVNLYGGGVVTLRGTAQTKPGNAGKLRLTASFGGRELASTNMFSVAAIPQDMVLVSITPVTGPRRGFVVTQTWSSDSGNVADLDEVQVAELVEYVTNTGCFSGVGAQNSWYIPANSGTLTDTHGTPVAIMTSFGVRMANQTEMFLDRRTGVTDIPMRNSGFRILRIVVFAGAGGRIITTSKAGAAVTAKGVASAAGAGSFTLSQSF
jgi:hypothetical protein